MRSVCPMSTGIATSSSAPCALTSKVLPRVKTGSGSSSSESEQTQTSTSISKETRSLRLMSRIRLLPLCLLGPEELALSSVSEGLALVSLADGAGSSSIERDRSCQSFRGNRASFGDLASRKENSRGASKPSQWYVCCSYYGNWIAKYTRAKDEESLLIYAH